MSSKKDNFMEELKLNIALQNCIENLNLELHEKEEKRKRGFFMKRKIIATACASLVLVSGIVIATNIQKSQDQTRGLGEGIDTAIENGYIATPNVEFINVENVGADVKLENFLMDDVNLSVNFVFDFDENITDTIDMEKVNHMELSDLIVRDEENRIIYSNHNKEVFEKYCKENNLNYTFGEFNENYMNNGLNAFISTKSDNFVKLTYNMYAEKFPRSKKLYFSFNTITLSEYTPEKETKYELTGEWKATVDVPAKMYNRTEKYYEVVSCDNDDFEVYASKVTDTGFELGVIISNIEKPEFDNDKFEEFMAICDAYGNNEISQEEYAEKTKWYYEYKKLAYPIQVTESFRGEKGKNSYVKNENGEKYESTMSPSRNAKTYYIEGKKYDFYETFGMTKNDATDKVTAVLYYYGTPVTIELQKK